MKKIFLNGESLTIDTVAEIANANSSQIQVFIDDNCIQRVKQSRKNASTIDIIFSHIYFKTKAILCKH